MVHQLGFDFSIAHCNFQLRGQESDADEQLVQQLAAQYGKAFFIQRFNTQQYVAEQKIAIQEAARKLRYTWFEQLVQQLKQTHDKILLATAHHADDNIETVLMNLFRGTGLQGLRGIQYYMSERSIIRPLLGLSKENILQYAQQHGLHWREDASNASDKYTRNFFRNQLLPAVEKVYPQARQNITQTIERLREVEVLYKDAVNAQLAKLVEQKGNEAHIPVLKLKKARPLATLVWEIIRYYGFTPHQTGEVVKLLDAHNGSYVASPTHRIILNRNWLIVAPIIAAEAAHVLIDQPNQEVVTAAGTLVIAAKPYTADDAINTDPFAVAVNAEAVTFPLLLRKWKQGDYFYPLGMDKKKKLGKFFIDQKLSKTDKENVWVLQDADHKIIWVVGLRIDNRVKLTNSSLQQLVLQWKKF